MAAHDPQPDERWRGRCRQLADLLIPALREVARQHGYALGVHGSLQRDIDLIAAPWSRDLSAPRVLAEAIRARAVEIAGQAESRDRIGAANPAYFDNGSPGAKPHGRLVWTFHLGGGPYIDLSVLTPADGDAAEDAAIAALKTLETKALERIVEVAAEALRRART